MNKQTILRKEDSSKPLTAEIILNSLGSAVLVIDNLGRLMYANNNAEQLFENCATQLIGSSITDLLPGGGPVFNLVTHTLESSINVSEYGVELESPRITKQLINIQITSVREPAGWVVINIVPRRISDKIDRQ